MMEENNGNDSKKRKNKNLFKAYREYQLRKKLEKERNLFAREERMKEDLERYLMQVEEQRCWLAYHLRHVNSQRMKKLQVLSKIHKVEQKKDDQQAKDNLKEDGLNFYQGNVVNYRRWQNSPAKYRDFVGHKDTVTACRISPCKKYILSCSSDTSMRLWDLSTSECIKIYHGHAKVVNDADMHPTLFKMYSLTLNIASASGDGTIRLWNTSDTKPITTIFAHQSAVYRCLFSPDGNTIISCSEDKTIRTWNYPEGYNIFVYSAHHSPVVSLRYSQSGRYFVSGSDYGERKIMLWDAKFPHMYEPAKFPHIIYWTTTGLIKKILIRQDNPRPGFWLAQNQLTWVANDSNLDIWPGELSDEDNFEEDQASDEDIDGEDEEDAPKKQEKIDTSRVGDIYEQDGVFINVLKVGKYGEKDSAVEYQPGGSLIVKIESSEYYIEEAYLAAYVKDSAYDIYSPESGRKTGSFSLDAPIPWLPMLSKIDSTGRKVYYRQAPEYVSQSKDGISVNYCPEKGHRKIIEPTDATESAAATPASSKDGFEIVWNCPEPLIGTVVLVFSFLLKGGEGNWLKLRYSMKESVIRTGEYATYGENKNKEEIKQYNFSPEKKHVKFWSFIRDKNWAAAATFIDKYAIAWVRDDVIRRRFRIMNLLVNMFEDSDWMILHSPFLFKLGVSKSVVLCESEYGAFEEDDEDEQEDDAPKKDRTDEQDPVGESGRTASEDESHNDDSSQHSNTAMARSNGYSREDVVPESHHQHISPEQELPLNPSAEVRFSNTSDNDNDLSFNENSREDVEAKEDYEPWLETQDNMFASNRFRPHTQPQHLPSVIFIKAHHKSIDRKSLEAEAERIASLETNKILSMLKTGIDIVGELPFSARRGAVLELLPRVEEEKSLETASQQIEKYQPDTAKMPQQIEMKLRAIDYDMVMDSLDKVIADFKHQELLSPYEQSEYARQLQAKHVLFPTELESTEGAPVVKSGRFGPEVDDFSMPLPSLFPTRAGAAKFALRPALEWFQHILRKMQVESLPRSMEEVYKPTWKERLNMLYHKLNHTEEKLFRKKLYKVLVDYVITQFMQDMAYVSCRRQTYHQLPGLVSHYPNPYYPNPAVVTMDTEYSPPERNKRSLFVEKVFGRPVNRSVVVPPVGRKPDKEKAFELQRQAYSAISQTANKALLQPMKSNFKVNVLDNLMKQDEDQKAKRQLSKGNSKTLQKGKSKPILLKTALVEYPGTFSRDRRGFYHHLPGLEEFAKEAMDNHNTTLMGEEEENSEDDEEFEWEPPPGLLRIFTIKDVLSLVCLCLCLHFHCLWNCLF
jgi:hypothetical protein